MNRSVRRESVFTESSDRRRFLKTLGEAGIKTGWRVPADVLVPNHFRWVIETPQPNLVAGMNELLAPDTNPSIWHWRHV
jgi:putative transposase